MILPAGLLQPPVSPAHSQGQMSRVLRKCNIWEPPCRDNSLLPLELCMNESAAWRGEMITSQSIRFNWTVQSKAAPRMADIRQTIAKTMFIATVMSQSLQQPVFIQGQPKPTASKEITAFAQNRVYCIPVQPQASTKNSSAIAIFLFIPTKVSVFCSATLQENTLVGRRLS